MLNSATSAGGGSGGRMATHAEPTAEESVEEVKLGYWPNEVTDKLHISSDGSFDPW